jgi:glycosyltransferase involved in cell wall biosynthesis
MKYVADMLDEGTDPLLSVKPAKSDRFSPHPDATRLFEGGNFTGKRAAMVSFSPYPFDPRPRRAADVLLKMGMSVDFFCLGEEQRPKREVLNGINVTRLPITHLRGGKLAYAYQYSAFILLSSAMIALRSLRRRYDLVYVHNMPDVLVVCSMFPKLFGAKVVLDQHDPMPELMKTIFNLHEDSLGVRLITKLEKWSIARVDRVVTVNVACKKIFAARSCPADKIAVIMNSPDETIFPLQMRPPNPSARDARKKFTVMYHGSIVERNGLDVGVDAFARVLQNIPNAELKIYGTKTPFLDQVMEQVSKLGLQDSVHYLGVRHLEDLVHEIDLCDVGIIPNQRNAFTDINTPTRLFEYLSRGKPVIAPRTAGIQDYFDPESLFFFEPGDVAGLTQQIEYVASHVNKTDEVVDRGQQVYLENRWTRQQQTLMNMIAELLNEGRTA